MNRALFAPARALAPALLLAPVLLMTMAAPVAARNSAPPIPGGPLGTLALGRYNCEKDGDAGGPVGIPVPTLNFQVVIYSSYKGVDGVRGSYLLTGDDVVMTGGGLRGMRLHRISPGFLRVVGADGADTETRCVLSSRRPQFHGDSGSSSDSDSDG